MILKKINIFISLAVFFGLSLCFSSCSTGIENTKTIKYTKSDKKELASSPEESLIGDILPEPLKDWKKGKRFMISDDRAALVFENRSNQPYSKLKGKEVAFEGLVDRISPGGDSKVSIVFSDGKNEYLYPTGKNRSEALDGITSLDIPMLIDLATVDSYRKKLEGIKVWTRSSLRYTKDGEKFAGKRFVPVTIKEIAPGDMLFMIHLVVTDENGEESMAYMNPIHRGLESRTFADLFFVADPKIRHSSIRPEIWELICEGKVKSGMTKEECKLALGNPDDVATGHDWNQTIDIWNYKNGMYLQFQDGLLTKFRI